MVKLTAPPMRIPFVLTTKSGLMQNLPWGSKSQSFPTHPEYGRCPLRPVWGEVCPTGPVFLFPARSLKVTGPSQL